jgi:hypothetical protein
MLETGILSLPCKRRSRKKDRKKEVEYKGKEKESGMEGRME